MASAAWRDGVPCWRSMPRRVARIAACGAPVWPGALHLTDRGQPAADGAAGLRGRERREIGGDPSGAAGSASSAGGTSPKMRPVGPIGAQRRPRQRLIGVPARGGDRRLPGRRQRRRVRDQGPGRRGRHGIRRNRLACGQLSARHCGGARGNCSTRDKGGLSRVLREAKEPRSGLVRLADQEFCGTSVPGAVALRGSERAGESSPACARPRRVPGSTREFGDDPMREQSMPTKTPEKKTARKAGGSGKPSALQKPLQPSKELAAVVGPGSLPRTEVVSKVWDYIRSHKLQNPENRREILADDKLRKVFGKDKVTMFEMNKHLAQHLT